MKLIIKNHTYHYETENLVRVFFPNEKIETVSENAESSRFIETKLEKTDFGALIFVKVSLDMQLEEEKVFPLSEKRFDDTEDSYFERKLAQLLFNLLKKSTGYTPPWGILTGVRPAKLMTNLCVRLGEEKACDYFINELFVSEEKTRLALFVSKKEQPIIEKSADNSFSLYISIPFCPTRCSYCSFVSHSNESAKKLMEPYVKLLCREIEQTGRIAKELSLKLESVYFGGGTPSVLDVKDLGRILDAIYNIYNVYFVC